MDTATRSTPCLSSVGIRSRRSCMANSQQKNHPNERMNTTAVLRDGVAAARGAPRARRIGHARAVRRARVTATPASAARGSEGRVRGEGAQGGGRGRGGDRGGDRGAARRGAAGSVVRRGGGEDEASARGTQGGARARDTWCSRDGSVLSGAGDEEEGAKARDKEDGRTHPRAVARSRRAAGRATHALVAAAMARCECRGFGVGGKEGTKRSRLKVQKNTATPHNKWS